MNSRVYRSTNSNISGKLTDLTVGVVEISKLSKLPRRTAVAINCQIQQQMRSEESSHDRVKTDVECANADWGAQSRNKA